MCRSSISLLSFILIFGLACSQADQAKSQQEETHAATTAAAVAEPSVKTLADTTVVVDSVAVVTETVTAPKITFVELGSVNCIPCKQMQPVMKAIEEKYGDQVKVIFHDVWKDPEPGKKYDVKMIPTQVFLDADGNELFRHVGFFPEAEIDAFLQKQGLTIVNPPTEG